ncbi:MFS transporter [Patescibacteria group bacterium]|nr:MFS transporter [Patescibacteria group bacterium]
MNKSLKGLMILHFLNDGVRTTFPTLLPFIAKDLNINFFSIGFLGSTQSLVAAALALPAGLLASRLGGFHFLIILLILYSAGALTASLSPSLPFIIFAFFLAAFGFGMFHTVSFSLVAQLSKKEDVGKNMGEFTSIGDIGRVAIPPTAVFLVSLSGWRLSMITVALIGLSAFLLIRFLSPKKEVHHLINNLKPETPAQFIAHIARLLKTKSLSLTLLTAIIDSLASSPIYLFLTLLLLSKGLQITQYGIVSGAFFVGSLLGKYILGRQAHKIGDIKLFIISEITMAVTLVLLTFPTNFFLILILSSLLGIFTRGTTPIIQSMLSKTSHKVHYNKIYALSEMFIGIAAVISVILMGFIADQANIPTVFYTSAALAVLATIPALFLLKLNSLR